ncbi:MAG: triosephosphate isomerase [Bacilli bacterium]|nr:triosephosphate isomerase [Bacilli bacterium]
MEKRIVVNQKLYLNTLEENDKFIKLLNDYKDKFIVIPSTIYIPFYIRNNFITGSQNISDETDSPHTGEISPKSLSDLSVKYVLIGHAEIREKYKDENIRIKKKIENALNNNLKVILCVGEKEKGKLELIDEELEEIDNKDIIISYEPVWAIGSNETPSNSDIKMVASHIKEKGFKEVYYGGSVNEDNIESLSKIDNIDGFLIGSCSLKPNSIIKMIEVVSK